MCELLQLLALLIRKGTLYELASALVDALPLARARLRLILLVILHFIGKRDWFSRQMQHQAARKPLKTLRRYPLHYATHLQKCKPAPKDVCLLPRHALKRHQHTTIKAHTAL